MVVSPFDCEFERPAFVIIPHGPVVVLRNHASYEEIMPTQRIEQDGGVAGEDVLLAHRPGPPFYVDFVPKFEQLFSFEDFA